MSGILAVFSPLPILLLGMRRGPLHAVVACFTNAILVYYGAGAVLFQLYSIGIVGLVVFLLFFLNYRLWSLERTLAGAWGGVLVLFGLLVCAYADLHRVTPFAEFQRIVTTFFDFLLSSLSPEAKNQLFGEVGLEEWRRKSVFEFPTHLAIFGMVMIFVNLHVIVNLNPNRFLQKRGMDRRVIFRWKNADFLVWPALALWASSLFLKGMWAEIAVNALKLFMAAYALQGLAILGSVLNAWKIRGFFRMFFYGLVVFFMMPLVLGVGFFDQWFDFRAKLRQS